MKYTAKLLMITLALAGCVKDHDTDDGGVSTDGSVLDAASGTDGAVTDGSVADAAVADGAIVIPDAGPLPTLNTARLDLLFVVDNSNSMAEEQEALAAQIPEMVRSLVAGKAGDVEFPPVADLNVGVISTDMGTGGVPVSGCSEPNLGDDGALTTAGNTSVSGCEATYPSFLNLTTTGSGSTEADAFSQSVACVAQLGTWGCGFEQQLEAMLKAVSPSTRTDFFNGTSGQGDALNEGFLRDDATLAIILISDEDDCSVSDPSVYDEDATEWQGGLNLRCAFNPNALHPISRFVEGLLAVRPADRLIFAPIVGVPVELIGEEYDDLLSAEAMQATQSSTSPSRLATSCDTSVGEAYPPRRIVQVAAGLDDAGARVELQSICQEDYSDVVAAIVSTLGLSGGADE